MKPASIYLILLFSVWCVTGTFGQQPSPTPAPDLSSAQPASNMGAASDMGAAVSPGGNPITIDLNPSPAPTPALPRPNTQSTSVYRSGIKLGILVASGAEITFPNVPVPDLRTITSEQNHLVVTDTKADGTQTVASWDLGSLTDQYMQHAPPKGAQLNQLDPDSDPDGNTVRYGCFNRLPREQMLTYNPKTPNDVNYDVDATVFLGSVFVDTTNRVLFTPPSAQLIYPIPGNVDQINCVTTTARNGIIVFETSNNIDDNYHITGLNINTMVPVFDFAPEDSLEAHETLDWVNNNELLGEFAARGSSHYSVLNVGTKVLTAKTKAASNKVRVSNGQVTVFNPPDQGN